MANVQVYRWGVCDNEDFYNLWIQVNPLLKGLLIRNLNIPPLANNFTNSYVPTMSYFITIGRSIELGQRADVALYLTVAMAEILGPYLPQNIFATNAEARVRIINAVSALISSDTLGNYTTIDKNSYIQGLQDPAMAGDNYLPGSHPDDWPDTHVPPSPEAAVRILYRLAVNATLTGMKSGLVFLTHVYVSVLKRGVVSDAFVDKVTQGILTDLGKPITLTPEALKKFYTVYGSYIDDVSIREITTHWTNLLPVSALRLILTVQQAAGSGLTCLITTGRAMRKYPDFQWGIVRLLLPEDWTNFMTAVRTVNGNIWYGFKRDLGVVRSTLYKNISWVGKELLVRVNGEAALNRYGGWVRRIPNQQRIVELIDTYVDQHGSQFTPEEKDISDGVFQGLHQVLTEGDNLEMYGA